MRTPEPGPKPRGPRPRPRLETRGRPWAASSARAQLRLLVAQAGEFAAAPRISCATHAVEMAREGVSLNLIQRQLGPQGRITSLYLEGIDDGETIGAAQARQPADAARDRRTTDLRS